MNVFGLFASAHSGAAAILLLLLPLLLMPLFGSVATGGLDATTFEPILKEFYTTEKIWSLLYEDHPLLKWTQTDESFQGKKMPIPIHYGNPTGRSHTFATGKANINPSKYTDFYLTVADDFGFVRIDHKTIKAARANPGAFLRAKEPEIDGMFQMMGRNMSMELYGNGSGSRGVISAGTVLASTALVLANVSDVVHFEVDQIIKLASDNPANPGAAGAGVRAGRLQITAIDTDTGTLTVDQNINGGVAAADHGDYIYLEGDYQAAASGLDGWFPATSPAPGGGDDWFDVDRSVFPSRLAGTRYDAASAGDSPITSLIRGLGKHRRNGGKADALFCEPSFWTACEEELGAKTHYYNPGDEDNAAAGFTAIRINYEGGTLPLYSDIDCPADTVYGLRQESMKRYSMGAAPSTWNEDGLEALRSTDSNDLDVQAYGYWNLGVRAPLHNVRVTVTPQAYA